MGKEASLVGFRRNRARRFSILTLIFLACGLPQGLARIKTVAPTWKKTYQELLTLVGSLESGGKESAFFQLLREGSILSSIPATAASIELLRASLLVAESYRGGIQSCAEAASQQNLSRPVHSYEYFGWLIDNLTTNLHRSISQELSTVRKDPVVTTERAWTALIRLGQAYLEEKMERAEVAGWAIEYDKTMHAALGDIARVLKVDLTAPFSRKEALAKGIQSQKGFESLSPLEGGIDLSLVIEPLTRLVNGKYYEPHCRIELSKPLVAGLK